MKYFLLILLIAIKVDPVTAQRIEKIYFNLYTDSLKKGVHNYINAEAKLSDGTYLPLTTDEIFLSSSAGKWDRNSIILDNAYIKDSVAITMKLKSDTSITKTIIVYLKKVEVQDKLKTKEEILGDIQRKGRQNFVRGVNHLPGSKK